VCTPNIRRNEIQDVLLLMSDSAGGAVALVAQDDYYNTRISISYSNGKRSTPFKLILLLTHILVKILPRMLTSTR
jgi:hypothetical protein